MYRIALTPRWKEARSRYLLKAISSCDPVLKVMTPNCAALGPNWKWPAKAFTKSFSRVKSRLPTLPDSSINIPTSTLQTAKDLFQLTAELAVVFTLLSYSVNYVIHQKPETVFYHIPNEGKKVENMTLSEVFFTNIEVFGNVVKHWLECLIYLDRS